MKRRTWGIFTDSGELMEGGFFDRNVALEARDADYPTCSVLIQRDGKEDEESEEVT